MTSTRDRIIRKTAELLTCQGYHATGLSQIVRESEAPRGSPLYHYFPNGKEELAAEAVRFRGEQMRDHVAYELARYDDVREAVRRLIETVSKNLVRRDFGAGAPVAAVSMEASSASEVLCCSRPAKRPIRRCRRCSERSSWRRAMRRRRPARQPSPSSPPSRGGLVLSYAAHTTEPLEHVGAAVEGYLSSLRR